MSGTQISVNSIYRRWREERKWEGKKEKERERESEREKRCLIWMSF